jgi:hypothetical protein
MNSLTTNRIVFKICLVACLFFAAVTSYSQSTPSGFYVIINDNTGCVNTVAGFTSFANEGIGTKTYCVTKAPLIPVKEFASVSQVQYDKVNDVIFVDLNLTDEGFRILKSLTKSLPDAILGLVIDDRVVGTYNSLGKMVTRTIPISGSKDGQEIYWIYNKLSKAKP